MAWSEQDEQMLCERFAAGDSFTQIARKLKCTRNAALGKAHRMGLARGEASSPRARSATAINAASASLALVVRNAKARKPDQPLPAPKGGAIAAAPRLWTERRFGECAFPVGGDGAETVSCCNATGGPTYCAAHARIMRGAPSTDAQRQAARRMREARAKTMRAA